MSKKPVTTKTEKPVVEQEEIFLPVDSGIGNPAEHDEKFHTDLFGAAIRWKPKKIGVSLTGIYRGMEDVKIGEKTFSIALIDAKNQERYSVSGHALISKLLPMYPENVLLRITYIGDIEMVSQPEPMKNYRIDVADKDMEKIKAFRESLQGIGEKF